MFLCDSHFHTVNSFDGHSTLDEICDRALTLNFSELAVTDHCDIDDILDGIYPAYDEAAINEAAASAREKYAGRLVVSHGIELGQAHLRQKESEALLARTPHDFVLGSIHNLPNVPDFSFLKFERMSAPIYENLWERSLDECEKIVKSGLIDSLAHITYPIRYLARALRPFDMKKYYPRLRELFGLMIERRVALEVNTSGLRQGLGFTLPDRDIMQLYYQCGGRMVTCGSDAHYARDFGSGIRETYKMLREIGFDSITVFHGRKPVSVRIESDEESAGV